MWCFLVAFFAFLKCFFVIMQEKRFKTYGKRWIYKELWNKQTRCSWYIRIAVGTVVPQLVSRVFHSHGTLVTPAMVHSCYKLSFSPYVVLLTSLATKGSDNFFLTPFNSLSWAQAKLELLRRYCPQILRFLFFFLLYCLNCWFDDICMMIIKSYTFDYHHTNIPPSAALRKLRKRWNRC